MKTAVLIRDETRPRVWELQLQGAFHHSTQEIYTQWLRWCEPQLSTRWGLPAAPEATPRCKEVRLRLRK